MRQDAHRGPGRCAAAGRGLSVDREATQVRQRLGAIPAIKTMTVRTLEAERADIRLEYFGTTEQLQQTLMQAGLLLARDAGEWRLQAR